jgi:hypothetical protein
MSNSCFNFTSILDIQIRQDYLQYQIKHLNFYFLFFPSIIGQYQILLQLKIHPITVLQGVGVTYEEAKRKAAYNALAYIKLLCSS